MGKVPIALLEIEFLALALGPKKCDFDVKNLKNFKSIGRLQFELDIK
jgi:hypothetical protein